jgi:hypothetical protein
MPRTNGFAKLCVAMLLIATSSTNARAQPETMKLKFGTWKLNLEKSKFPEGARPRSDTRIYADKGNGLMTSTHTAVDPKGEETLTTYAARFDGKEYPVVTRGSAASSGIAFHIIDAYSESFVLTRDGKIAVRGTTSISEDGRTLTMTLNRTNAQGKTERTINVYEKQ